MNLSLSILTCEHRRELENQDPFHMPVPLHGEAAETHGSRELAQHILRPHFGSLAALAVWEMRICWASEGKMGVSAASSCSISIPALI